MTRATGGGSYDYVVVGAGPAGCVVAARLAEDPGTRVLLVEAGGPVRGLFLRMPAALPYVYQRSSIQWGYQSGPEPHLGGRSIDEKAGKLVGGSSSINAMIFNRGNPMDYDGWARLGLPEWSYAHCLPYFRRMETFEDGADDWRGGEGPLRVGRNRAEHTLFETSLRSGEQAGCTVTPDHNGFRQEGLHIAQSFIHVGLRWNAERAYLRPALGRPNLELLTGAAAEKVVVDGGRASGVVVSGRGGRRTVVCDREVVLSAGAYNSPKLLLLSGIGDTGELRRHGIRSSPTCPPSGATWRTTPASTSSSPPATRTRSPRSSACSAAPGSARAGCSPGRVSAPATCSRPARSCAPGTASRTPTCSTSSCPSPGGCRAGSSCPYRDSSSGWTCPARSAGAR